MISYKGRGLYTGIHTRGVMVAVYKPREIPIILFSVNFCCLVFQTIVFKKNECVETGYRYNNFGIEMYIIDKVVVQNLWVFYI